MDLTADYLIIGSGAMGMAFADILVEESEATLIIIDKNEAPEGIGILPILLLPTPTGLFLRGQLARIKQWKNRQRWRE